MNEKIDSTVDTLLKELEERNLEPDVIEFIIASLEQEREKEETFKEIQERTSLIDSKIEAEVKKDLVCLNERKTAYLQNPSSV